MQVLRAASHRRMAWKNGGGETLEIAAFPEGSSLDDFGWRVSVATVAVGGPFSTFPGVDRTLAILSGEGMELTVEGVGTRLLKPGSPPLAFPADAAASARLLGGPVTDLNAMTRRGVFTARVVELPRSAFPVSGVLIVVAAEASAFEADGEPVALATHDACLFPGPASVRRTGGRLFGVEIAPVPS